MLDGSQLNLSTTPTGTTRKFVRMIEDKMSMMPESGRYHRIPRRFEHDYVLLEQDLGTGYNGVVKLAMRRDAAPDDPRRYAVKAFRLSTVKPERQPEIEAEVCIFLNMDHPHVARLHDVYCTQECLHFVMERMEGGELFDRVHELKTFPEKTAAEAVCQMLMAVNYLHDKNLVHCDIKLENFLYDKPGSDHLKLIDFGFSKAWNPNSMNNNMAQALGTLSYTAPEWFANRYTQQRDVWSLGVITYILLCGKMPFFGSEAQQIEQIRAGSYAMDPQRWDQVSAEAKDFVSRLLVVDPAQRLTAQAALEHTWITDRDGPVRVDADPSLVAALRSYARASRFRRCCLEMLAWSLTNEERAKVRTYFTSMDRGKQGTVTLVELKAYLEANFEISDEDARQIFRALDIDNDAEVRYSEFLAAMVGTRIDFHDDLLRSTFRRFDRENSGYIRKDTMRDLLGDAFNDEEFDKLLDLNVARQTEDGRISCDDFVRYMKMDPKLAEGLLAVIDGELFRKGKATWPQTKPTRKGLTRAHDTLG